MESINFVTIAKEAVDKLTTVMMNPNNKFNKEQIAKIIPESNNIMASISHMAAIMAKLEGELAVYKNLSQNQPTQKIPDLCETIMELEERKEKSKNAIFLNVPESELSQEENLTNDSKIIISTIKKIDDIPTQNLKIYRLGAKKPGVIRPIKVEFEDSFQVKHILRNKFKITDGIKIKPDLTITQRNHMKNLIIELEQRKNSGETNLTIKYVHSIPKIVQQHTPKNYKIN